MDIRDKIDIFLYSAGCNQHSSTYSSTEYHFVLYNAYIKHEEFYYRKLWMGPDGEFLKKSGQCHLWSFKERSPKTVEKRKNVNILSTKNVGLCCNSSVIFSNKFKILSQGE